MEKNIILAGVGGQGILSIAFVIDNAALDSGFHFKQAEVHGMAQRGGAVQSHLRYGDSDIYSDIVPTGRADLILSVEPLEVLRYWHYLQPEGWVVTSVTPYINIPDYPELDDLLGELAAFSRIVTIDSANVARAAGNLRSQNMAVVGAASPLLDFSESQLLKFVELLFSRKGEKIVEINQRAFKMGRAAGLFFRGLVDAGMPSLAAIKLSAKIAVDTLDPIQAPLWAEAIGEDDDKLAAVLTEKEAVACDSVATYA
jgi:indolepyruvate ferredoxin oxidoreductase beta subunit